jgi:hypothetical protein
MAGNGYKYGYTGPPFNFLGNFCTTQWNAFTSWVNARTVDFPAIQQHYQIRAAQLRKTAGALDQFYSTLNDEKLSPTFNKLTWKPGTEGWFGYVNRNDHLPMAVVYQMKGYMKDRLERQDEGVFAMNHVRNVIEKTEDKAQRANEATASIATLINRISSYFNQPEYAAVLVKDQSDVYPTGSSQPRYRVSQLDVPTQWEREQAAHQLTPGGPTNIKETGQ